MPSRDDHRNESSGGRNRRRFLKTIGALGTGGLLAGCLGDGDDTTDALPETSDDGNGAGPTDTDDPGEAVFEVTGLDPAEVAVDIGDTFDVSAVITNTGDADGSRDVAFRIDDETRATERVALDASAEKTITFEDIGTAGLEAGQHEHGVSTEVDGMTGTLNVSLGTTELIRYSTPGTEVPNGAWTWFNTERAIVDAEASRVLVGSVSSGGSAAGDVVVQWYDPDDRRTGNFVLHEGLENDDHDDPALMLRPDGRYLAVYAGHNRDDLTRWRLSSEPHDPTSWGEERTFDNGEATTYSNTFRLPEDRDGAGRTYTVTRTRNWDPNVLVSTDAGTSFSYGGRLLQRGGGGDRPYPRYAADDERIHLTVTEEHPRDFDNGVYHAYLSDGVLYDSHGDVLNEDVLDGTMDAPDPAELTTVFDVDDDASGRMTRSWTVDTALDGEGQPVALFQTRHEDDWQDHRFFYARFDGDSWEHHHIAKAGAGLYDGERDYTGLGSIDPDDPSRLVISTTVDPETDGELANHELFLGETGDGGASWEWTALTEESGTDNLRPLWPAWSDERSALVWMRGQYNSYTSWNTQVVGIADMIQPVD
jgi:hypothetical protein